MQILFHHFSKILLTIYFQTLSSLKYLFQGYLIILIIKCFNQKQPKCHFDEKILI